MNLTILSLISLQENIYQPYSKLGPLSEPCNWVRTQRGVYQDWKYGLELTTNAYLHKCSRANMNDCLIGRSKHGWDPRVSVHFEYDHSRSFDTCKHFQFIRCFYDYNLIDTMQQQMRIRQRITRVCQLLQDKLEIAFCREATMRVI